MLCVGAWPGRLFMSVRIPETRLWYRTLFVAGEQIDDLQQLNVDQKRVNSEIIFVCSYYVPWTLVWLIPGNRWRGCVCARDISVWTTNFYFFIFCHKTAYFSTWALHHTCQTPAREAFRFHGINVSVIVWYLHELPVSMTHILLKEFKTI